MNRFEAYKRKRDQRKSTWLAPMLSAGFGAGATALGFPAFAPAAGALGGYLGQKFKDITGYGDYTVNKNSIMSGTVPGVSNISYTPNALCVSHKEYIGDVITSKTAGAFAITSWTINPNNPQLWEWLSQIACNYEEWVPEGIVFYFKSTSGDALSSTNTALGTVIMATNYNYYNAPFTTKAEMESYEYCSNGPPCSDIMHGVECDPSQGSITTYYMDSHNQNQNAGILDQRFNILGTFYLATTGFQGTSVNIGELWVTYQVSLLKPKLYSSLGYANDYFRMSGNMAAATTSGLFQIVTYAARNNMPYTVTNASTSLYLANGSNTGTIYWPVYPFYTSYIVTYYISGSSVTTPTISLAHSAGDYDAAVIPITGFITQAPSAGLPGAGNITYYFSVNVPGGFIKSPKTGISPNTQITFSSPGPGGASPYIELSITQIPIS